MAGTYPDVPGYRFAYDKDGTNITAYRLSDGVNMTLAQNQAATYNRNNVANGTSLLGSTQHVAWLFPEPRDLSGIFANFSGDMSGTLDWSNDTTNGYDGSWNTIANTSTLQVNSGTLTLQRTGIYSLSLTAVTSLRFSNINEGTNRRFMNIHLYGYISPAESPDRLRIVDMSGDDIAAQLDFGDIRQRNNMTKQFKVVNNSSTKTANNITITLESGPDANPSLIGQYQLSTDNTAFATAINIGNLAPGASSDTLHLRNTVAHNAQLSVWSLRLIASANTWS